MLFAVRAIRSIDKVKQLWVRIDGLRARNANKSFVVSVKAIHPKAMSVILTTPAEVETWLAAPTPEALALQGPLPDGALKIVARGDRTGDGVAGEKVI